MSCKKSSNLDTLETSVDSRPPESYRKFCISNCKPEYDATSEAIAVKDEIDGTNRLKAFNDCRTGAWFARNVVTGKVKVLSSSCKNRWCPMCASTRRWFLSQQVSEWLTSAKDPKFLTLTLKHTRYPLDDQIQKLYDSFKKYRKLKDFKKHVKGGVWFFQIHKAKSDNLWHCHLHCVLDAEWMDKYKLSAAWEVITQDSKIVNIKEVKDPEKMSEYVARYAARPSMLAGLEEPDRLELMTCLHGRRLVGTWGTARAISLRPAKPPDSEDWKHVGYFSTVVAMLGSDSRADSIWQAYKNDSEIPEDCNLRDIENFTGDKPIHNSIIVDEFKQLNLGFF